MNESQKPIGVFDSGIGGLTVVKAIRNILPLENIIYLGDTARVPYGTRGRATIIQFARELTATINQFNPKIIVVACNTMSAVALQAIVAAADVPVINVILPTIQAALMGKPKSLGVIGTSATMRSGAYQQMIAKLSPSTRVHVQACPLFVPMIEEGMRNGPAAHLIAQTYLRSLKKERIQSLILGCTHYPLMRSTISKVIGRDVLIHDSAQATADTLKEILSSKEILKKNGRGNCKIFLTDDPSWVKGLLPSLIGSNKCVVKKITLSAI